MLLTSMLPRSTSSPVFALLCLWVATLAVFVSPLPVSNGTQTLPMAGPSRPPGVQVDLHVVTTNRDTPTEHLMLAIGETVIHAADMPSSIVLVPQKVEWSLETAKERGYHVENIGKASFTNQKDEQKVTKEMLDVRMPPFTQKGTCLDYITMVLAQLGNRGCIDESVQRAYAEIYKQRLERHTRELARMVGKHILSQRGDSLFVSPS